MYWYILYVLCTICINIRKCIDTYVNTNLVTQSPYPAPPSSDPIPVILISFLYTTYCYYTNCSNPECYYWLL